MNTDWYNEIFDSFKFHHPYMIDKVVNFRPKGDKAIRVTLEDGSQYDYDVNTKGARKVIDFTLSSGDGITDDWCRESFSYHLIEQMGLKGYSQQTLAKDTGLGKGSIYNYINKKATPSMTALRKIAMVLDCSIADLID